MESQFVNLIKKEISGVKIHLAEKLSNYTTFKIGGSVDLLLEPETKESLAELIRLIRGDYAKWRVLGGGSNLLVSDDRISEPVIYLRNFDLLRILSIQGETIKLHVGAGLKTKKLLAFCLGCGFAGCEFLAGIPGTIGGAIVQNAGTPVGCMADIVSSVEVITPEGKCEWYDYKKDFSPSYRNSNIPDDFIVISAILLLAKSTAEKVESRVRTVMKQRLESQPLGKPSAGCVFKNPSPHISAGFLIDKCGFKGFRIGGAMVSEKHANWIINTGGATFSDVMAVIERIKREVKKTAGVELEEEINIWA